MHRLLFLAIVVAALALAACDVDSTIATHTAEAEAENADRGGRAACSEALDLGTLTEDDLATKQDILEGAQSIHSNAKDFPAFKERTDWMLRSAVDIVDADTAQAARMGRLSFDTALSAFVFTDCVDSGFLVPESSAD